MFFWSLVFLNIRFEDKLWINYEIKVIKRVINFIFKYVFWVLNRKLEDK